MKEGKILRAVVDGVEYRCQETYFDASDHRGQSYTETRRSQWLSKDGKIGDDRFCMTALLTEKKAHELEVLRAKLWGDE